MPLWPVWDEPDSSERVEEFEVEVGGILKNILSLDLPWASSWFVCSWSEFWSLVKNFEILIERVLGVSDDEFVALVE